jgi:hypothetical protein
MTEADQLQDLEAHEKQSPCVVTVDGPAHLPPHTTSDIEFGKSVGERWSIGLTMLNVTNTRYLLGLDRTFAGTHYNDPRMSIGSVRREGKPSHSNRGETNTEARGAWCGLVSATSLRRYIFEPEAISCL